MFFSEDGCPGKFGSIFYTLAYGLDSELDKDFSCKATKRKYEKQKASCEKAIYNFERECVSQDEEVFNDDDQRFINEFTPNECEYSVKFDQYAPGDFRASPLAIKKGRKKRAPHSDDYSSREGSFQDEK